MMSVEFQDGYLEALKGQSKCSRDFNRQHGSQRRARHQSGITRRT